MDASSDHTSAPESQSTQDETNDAIVPIADNLIASSKADNLDQQDPIEINADSTPIETNLSSSDQEMKTPSLEMMKEKNRVIEEPSDRSEVSAPALSDDKTKDDIHVDESTEPKVSFAVVEDTRKAGRRLRRRSSPTEHQPRRRSLRLEEMRAREPSSKNRARSRSNIRKLEKKQ